MFVMHGAVYLCLKTDGLIQEGRSFVFRVVRGRITLQQAKDHESVY